MTIKSSFPTPRRSLIGTASERKPLAFPNIGVERWEHSNALPKDARSIEGQRSWEQDAAGDATSMLLSPAIGDSFFRDYFVTLA
jgi:hypothetical protein